ncbi:MAG: dihydropteroate synthase [Gammaproteobacteria bacterium]|nr:dihydropteroate synthase [Gammaproteobacteria bacterium]
MSDLLSLLSTRRPLVMGILNTTPDSFSDGGLHATSASAFDCAMKMIQQGADIIDVGGESTRPGAAAVSVKEELNRVLPVIQSIRQASDVVISIDTSKPEVMREAIASGASCVNDVNALRAEGALDACAGQDVPVCLMHMQGEPRTMQQQPQYGNVVDEVKSFLQQRVECCIQAGIRREQIIIDPGFGFGKTLQHNLLLLKHLDQFVAMGLPVLVGLSRKSMLGAITGEEVDQRIYASVAAAVVARAKGAAIFRVHDVKATVDALKVAQAVIDVD